MRAKGKSIVTDAGSVQADICICAPNLPELELRTILESAVREFKGRLAIHFRIPVEQQILMYDYQILKDDNKTLASYGLKDKETVKLDRAPVGVGQEAGAAASVFLSNGLGSAFFTSFSEKGKSSVTAAGGELVALSIRSSYYHLMMRVETSLEFTVWKFKVLLLNVARIPVEEQCLYYEGQILKDDRTLASYCLKDKAKVMVDCFRAPAAPPAAVPTSAENTNNDPPATQGGNPNIVGAGQAGTAASLFQGRGLGFEFSPSSSTKGKSSVTAAGGELVTLKVDGGGYFGLSLVKTDLEFTVREFKILLVNIIYLPVEEQCLCYKGQILKDDQTLASYCLQDRHIVYVNRPPSAENTNNAPPATQGGNPNTVGAGQVGTVASLFPELGLGGFGGTGGGTPGLFGAGLPEFERVQQQLTENPNMMRDIMNMTAIQNLMNDPEIMRSLIMCNPQMRDITGRNPELAHILNDPSILRQTLEAARNPELLRKMMLNNDGAMSNENVQECFLNATTMGGRAAGDAGSNPFAALLGNQGAAQNREGPNSSTAGPELTTGTTVPNTNPLSNPCSNTGGTQTNNTARANPTGEARAPSVAGLGGLGHPELECTGMPDPSTFSQFMHLIGEQMMRSFLSNPRYLDFILFLNPQLRSMFDMNPRLREVMQNPELLRELTSPSTLE